MAPKKTPVKGAPGGFMDRRSGPQKPREQRMRWTVDNDRKLLLVARGRAIDSKEHEAIAKLFPEEPTVKSIAVRLAKLKSEQMELLEEYGVLGRKGENEESYPASTKKKTAASTRLSGLSCPGQDPPSRKRGAAATFSRFSPILAELKAMGVPADILRRAAEEGGEEVSGPVPKKRKRKAVPNNGARFAPIMEALERLGVPAEVLREEHDEEAFVQTADEEVAAGALLALFDQ